MDTMYPAKVNSPATTLSSFITDSQTTISLTDASVVPAAPNLAVIGTGEDAETVLYTGKSGNDLTGCTRGFQGTAKAWDSGTSVARFFTAYDYDTLRTNLATHDPATTGVHGVGTDTIGKMNKDKTIQDADGDTGWETEQSADEDKLRGKTKGVECALYSDVGILTLPKQSRASAYLGTEQLAATGLNFNLRYKQEDVDTHNEFDVSQKVGNATATTADHLIDTTLNQFTAGDVGKYVYNTTDYTYAKITAYNSSSDVTLDTDIMVNGEGYEVYLNAFTVTEDGRYLITAVITFTDGMEADKRHQMFIKKNGSVLTRAYQHSSVAGWLATSCLATADLVANDYITIRTHNPASGNIRLWPVTDYTRVDITKIA